MISEQYILMHFTTLTGALFRAFDMSGKYKNTSDIFLEKDPVIKDQRLFRALLSQAREGACEFYFDDSFYYITFINQVTIYIAGPVSDINISLKKQEEYYQMHGVKEGNEIPVITYEKSIEYLTFFMDLFPGRS
ncbi:MAG: hypothetical protein LIP10_04025 [Clostridiales bacterium]|nr:hypothetical protein [Clostridiales bacterium]